MPLSPITVSIPRLWLLGIKLYVERVFGKLARPLNQAKEPLLPRKALRPR